MRYTVGKGGVEGEGWHRGGGVGVEEEDGGVEGVGWRGWCRGGGGVEGEGWHRGGGVGVEEEDGGVEGVVQGRGWGRGVAQWQFCQSIQIA